MSKKSLKPLSFAVGSLFATSLAVSNVSAATNAEGNPFVMNELSGGYMQLAAGEGYGSGNSGKEGKTGEKKVEKEGKCGEGKCGGKGEMKKNMGSSKGGKQTEAEGKHGDKK